MGNAKPVIGFWAGDCNNFSFLDPIIELLSKDFEVKKFTFNESLSQRLVTKVVSDKNQQGMQRYHSRVSFLINTTFSKLRRQLNSCDIAWFEWANGPIIWASQLKDIKTPIICRLHRYEAYSETPLLIDWSKVSSLIFIAESVEKVFKCRFPDQYDSTKSRVIRNGVDLTKFTADLSRTKGKKIAFVGRLHYVKNPSLMLQCMAVLVKRDPEYKLYIAGGFFDLVLEEYFWDQVEKLGLKDNVIYSGELKRDEISNWLSNKDYFLMTSIIEGQPVSVLEAMAEGLKPVIHNYFLAEEVFPIKYLFNTIEECVESILNDDFDRQEYFNYVSHNNSLEKQVDKIKEEIKSLLVT